jgi:hypothetical protein
MNLRNGALVKVVVSSTLLLLLLALCTGNSSVTVFALFYAVIVSHLLGCWVRKCLLNCLSLIKLVVSGVLDEQQQGGGCGGGSGRRRRPVDSHRLSARQDLHSLAPIPTGNASTSSHQDRQARSHCRYSPAEAARCAPRRDTRAERGAGDFRHGRRPAAARAAYLPFFHSLLQAARDLGGTPAAQF